MNDSYQEGLGQSNHVIETIFSIIVDYHVF